MPSMSEVGVVECVGEGREAIIIVVSTSFSEAVIMRNSAEENTGMKCYLHGPWKGRSRQGLMEAVFKALSNLNEPWATSRLAGVQQ